MKMFSALLALCEGNPPVTGGFPSRRPVTRSFLWCASEKTVEQTIATLVVWDAIAPLWRHCNRSLEFHSGRNKWWTALGWGCFTTLAYLPNVFSYYFILANVNCIHHLVFKFVFGLSRYLISNANSIADLSPWTTLQPHENSLEELGKCSEAPIRIKSLLETASNKWNRIYCVTINQQSTVGCYRKNWCRSRYFWIWIRSNL